MTVAVTSAAPIAAHRGVAASARSLTHIAPRSEATLREPSARGFLHSLRCALAPSARLAVAAAWRFDGGLA